MHFHERDLARSLLVYDDISCKFSDIQPEIDDININKYIVNILCSSTAFHHHKFISYQEASEWCDKYIDNIKFGNSLIDNMGTYLKESERLIMCSLDADNPYQFISKLLCMLDISPNIDLFQLPITQDASASAYQIMAYFLLDYEIAKKTNLIPSYSYKNISDIYIFFLEELKVYFRTEYDDNGYNIIYPRLTRKLVKKLFMPLIYGKTIKSMGDDIYQHFESLLSYKESMVLASHISNFFIQRFPGICNLMELIRCVSWLTSTMGKPIIYETPLLITTQDYMKT